MRTVVELVHIDCEDPLSILNIVDNKEKTIRKQLRIHIRNCKQALDDVDSLLKRYAKMSVIDRVAWAWKGHDEVNDLESNLSSFATQLDSFVNSLTLRGVGAVYQQQGRILKGIGRVEEALEKAKGNSVAAVGEVMQEVAQGKVSPGSTERYKSIISDYAQEVSLSTSFAKPRARTPDPGRGRSDSNGRLSLPLGHKRATSANTFQSNKTMNVNKGPLAESRALVNNKPNNKLECWLIQIKSGHLTLFTWQLSEKEIQCRGQWKLEEMARQFKSSKYSKLNNDHDLVKWVLEDKNKMEKDPDYLWRPYAAKIEEKGLLALNLGVEKQAMVIVKRQLTPEAQKRVDEKKRLEVARHEAVQNQRKKDTAQRKAKAAAEKNTKQLEEKQRKAEGELAKKAALIKKLEEENKLLKAQNKKPGEKTATEKTNNIEASSEGPHHPDNPIKAKVKSPINKARKGSGGQSKNDKQQETQGNVTATRAEPGSKDQTKVPSPKKSSNKGPKNKPTLKPGDSDVKVEDKVQRPKKNGQQRPKNSVVKLEESGKTDGAMVKEDAPQSHKKPPRNDAKAKEQDGHTNTKPIEQKKAKERDGHTNTKPIEQKNAKAKEQDGHTNTKSIDEKKAKERDGHTNAKPIEQGKAKEQITNDQQNAPA